MKLKKKIPDWLIGVAVTLFFLFVTYTGIFDFTDAIEMKTFDLRVSMSAPEDINPDIEIVAITDDDLSELGRFPWPRDILAQGINNLSLAGARVIALNILLMEPEESSGLKAVKKLKDDFDALGLAQPGPGLAYYQVLAEVEKDLDNDAKLYNAIRDSGNVVLPVYFDKVGSGKDLRAHDFVAQHAFQNVNTQEYGDDRIGNMIWILKMAPILPSFAEVAAGVGHNSLFQHTDGSVRNQVHAVGYLDNIYFPSYALAIAKIYKGLSNEDIILYPNYEIDLRISPSLTAKIPVIDSSMNTLINWNKGPEIVFHQTPFARVYKNEFQTSLFRDKIVIIGPTAEDIGDRWVTPVSQALPGTEVVANSVANILNQRFITKPEWVDNIETIILLVFGIYIAFALPKMKAGMGAITTMILFLAYGITGFVMFLISDIWIKISPQMLLLVVGYILIISKQFFVTEKTKEKVEADSAETNKMLGLSFQQQGMFDLALEKFRKIDIEEDGAKELLYNLGLDFERKRQFSKALSTYNLIIEDGKNFKDLDERLPKLKNAESTMIFGGSGGGGHPGDIGATLMNMDTKPTLGRYEILDELGRGAMGIVYKGEDPKIHRTVAIKTVRLSEFDEDSLDEMKERFFREAESAGLLTHPNIVTIYDAGEEHDLAYIAMEFLKGEDLEGFIKREELFPLRDTLSIIAQVADALDFAHSKNVVHRDIKPANIMRLSDTAEVKVTDFGIARITSSSKTKTGVIMGTPSYMSPEQVAGQKVDGRSDIFSLGVVLFEMLTGQKPFSGEDVTSLMYQIAKEPHPDIRSINQKIPQVITQIIDKALAKALENRYQRAGLMAEHLNKVIARIDAIKAKKEE